MSEIPIELWSKKFAKLYKNVDKGRKPEDFWLSVNDHLSQIGESIRTMNYPWAFRSAAHSFEWMCEYINHCQITDYLEFRLNLNLSEIIGLKYPDKCGHCINSPCQCKADKIENEMDKSARFDELFEIWSDKRKIYAKRSTVDWFKSFYDIYGNSIYLLSIDTIGFHLLEEAGEEARAIRGLLQFREVSKIIPDVIDDDYLLQIADIYTLIEEFKNNRNIVNSYFKEKGIKEEAFKEHLRTDNKKEVVRFRLLKAKLDLIYELSDTFSWYTSLLLKIKLMLDKMPDWILNEFDFDLLEKKLAYEYSYDFKKDNDLLCHSCKEKSCNCNYYIISGDQ